MARISPRISVVLAVVALLFAACGESSEDDDATEAPTAAATREATGIPTSEATSEVTAEAVAGDPSARPATGTVATLNQQYSTAGDGQFDATVMGVAAGDVQAQWYRANGFYVVVYEGLDLEVTGPLCPGNSIQTASGFEFVSNAASDGADCSSFPTLTSDPDVGLLVCQGVVSYRTAIPTTAMGKLFGTLERPVDGGIMGLTSLALTSGSIPEIDLGLLSC